MFRSVLLALAAVALTGAAHAADKCNAGPKDQWQPKEALEKKLTGEGWKVSRVKVEDGCYEVYGHDDKGAKVEAFFDPKTFAPAKK